MYESKTVVPALFASCGVFVVTAALLPRRGSFTSQGAVEYFFVSRDHWELPFLVAGGAFMILMGLAALVRANRSEA